MRQNTEPATEKAQEDTMCTPRAESSGATMALVETDIYAASPGLDSLMLRGLVEPAWTLLKGHCHRVACLGARELPEERNECIAFHPQTDGLTE